MVRPEVTNGLESRWRNGAVVHGRGCDREPESEIAKSERNEEEDRPRLFAAKDGEIEPVRRWPSPDFDDDVRGRHARREVDDDLRSDDEPKSDE